MNVDQHHRISKKDKINKYVAVQKNTQNIMDVSNVKGRSSGEGRRGQFLEPQQETVPIVRSCFENGRTGSNCIAGQGEVKRARGRLIFN